MCRDVARRTFSIPRRERAFLRPVAKLLDAELGRLSQGKADEPGYDVGKGVTTMGTVNLFWGWVGLLAGVLSGAVIGLFFHRDDWMGGYDSFRRRLTRLGHISFFGLGFVNILFGLTVRTLPLAGPDVERASWLLLLGALTMPLCCFLSAWRKPFRHLFPVPVACVLFGVGLLLWSWPRP